MSRIAAPNKATKHKCPIKGCNLAVSRAHLMCAIHWSLVPHSIGNAVYREYRRAPRSEAHFAAMKAAVECAQAVDEGMEPHQAAQHFGPRCKQSLSEAPSAPSV